MLKAGGGSGIPCLCVTNRKLCRGDFLERIRRIASGQVLAGPGMRADAVLLREKDLREEEYFILAEKVMKICEDFSVPCILHTFYRVAAELGCGRVHLPLDVLEHAADLRKGETGEVVAESSGFQAHAAHRFHSGFQVAGTSVHSVEQLRQAEASGVDYVIAGHIFATDCKKGMPGRGLGFLRDIVKESAVPVYGIGGIGAENAAAVMEAGASGVCVMSGFMLEKE